MAKLGQPYVLVKMSPLKRLHRKCYSARLGDKSLELPEFALHVDYGDAGVRSYSKCSSYNGLVLLADPLSLRRSGSCIVGEDPGMENVFQSK